MIKTSVSIKLSSLLPVVAMLVSAQSFATQYITCCSPDANTNSPYPCSNPNQMIPGTFAEGTGVQPGTKTLGAKQKAGIPAPIGTEVKSYGQTWTCNTGKSYGIPGSSGINTIQVQCQGARGQYFVPKNFSVYESQYADYNGGPSVCNTYSNTFQTHLDQANGQPLAYVTFNNGNSCDFIWYVNTQDIVCDPLWTGAGGALTINGKGTPYPTLSTVGCDPMVCDNGWTGDGVDYYF